jgi:hypothetical protein
MANINDDIEKDDVATERKGPGFPEIVVTAFVALFIIFLFIKIVFL